ncbi:MAG: class I SAM-dependent methyltransferase [Rhizobiales bacterium]|nr:class I SAM-dependent methyltransferase [Hyphomicrobiales bacterium]
MDNQAIKSMNLYSQVERIYSDLRAMGIADDAPLDVETLTPFDQYHYFGTDAVDEAIAMTGITAGSTVLDVGSGLGGPARYLAKATGCKVTALELQEDLNEVAAKLTDRCGLSGNIDHVCADVLAWQAPAESHDQLMSYLALYHIDDPTTLFATCATALKPGGRIYIEDLYGLGEFTDEEQRHLRHMLYGQNMASRTQYILDLQNAGFTDIAFTDMTGPWTGFCRERLEAYRAGRERQEAVHGRQVVEALDEFYATVLGLFEGGNMGGVRVTATKA